MSRPVLFAAVAAVLFVLARASVMVPALSLAALAGWAVFAAVLVCARRPVPREALRRYRTAAGWALARPVGAGVSP